MNDEYCCLMFLCMFLRFFYKSDQDHHHYCHHLANLGSSFAACPRLTAGYAIKQWVAYPTRAGIIRLDDSNGR